MNAKPRSRRAPRPLPVLTGWILAIVAVSSLPFLGLGDSWTRLIMLTLILALVVSGLNLTFGYAGEFGLAQVAIYAAGAYTAAFLATEVVNDLIVILLLAVLSAVIVGLITGAPGLRLGGWTLAITSFFVVLLIPSVIKAFGDTLGGLEGIQGIPMPAILGLELDNRQFYLFIVLLTAGWFAVFRNLVKSRYGSELLVLKQSPVLTSALGASPYWAKLKVYVIAAIPCGIAGVFAAYLDSFISPVSFGLDHSIVILAASILGGPMSIFGAFVGAAIMQFGPLRLAAFDQFSMIAYGLFLVIGGLLLRNGVVGLSSQLARRLQHHGAAPAVATPEPTATAGLPHVHGERLQITGISKRFGGNQALQAVSLSAQPGQITALIGPNGSGKTTLMNVISGLHRPDTGTIVLGDTRISGLPAFRVSRLGVGRTFQTPLIPQSLTVREVLLTGRLASHPVRLVRTALRLPKHWRETADNADFSHRLLQSIGLQHVADRPASELALGTRRMLELARAIAGGGSLVLLDEVASGLDEDDIRVLIAVLQQMRQAGLTVLLVEHNFTLVRSIADHVVVLAEGTVIAEGPPDEIVAHPEVVRSYLGESTELSGTRVAPATQSGGEQT